MKWILQKGFECPTHRERFRADMLRLATMLSLEFTGIPLVFASDLECAGARASEWLGSCFAGESIFLNDSAIIASGYINGFACLEAVWIHELAHAAEVGSLRARELAAICQSPAPTLTTGRVSASIAHPFIESHQHETHPAEFWRGLAHLFWRARRLNVMLAPEALASPGVYGQRFTMPALVDALYDEAHAMINCAFKHIHTTTPPQEFSNLFSPALRAIDAVA